MLDLRYEESGYYTDVKEPTLHISAMRKNNMEKLVKIKGDGKTSVVITKLCHMPTGDKVICVFNADDPRGNNRGTREIKIDAGKVKRTFSLKYPSGIELNDGTITLNSGDSVFVVVDKEVAW